MTDPSQYQQKFQPGNLVITTELDQNTAKDYTEEHLKNKRWGQHGIIIAYNDSHDHYDVRLLDGSISTYESTELKKINM